MEKEGQKQKSIAENTRYVLYWICGNTDLVSGNSAPVSGAGQASAGEAPAALAVDKKNGFYKG